MDSLKPQVPLLFVASWFLSATTALIFTLVLTFYLSFTRTVNPVNQSFKLYAALPSSELSTSDTIATSDARAKIIENFFKGYKAPLSQFGETFVKVADKYSLDYGLLPSIAMQESNGGLRLIKDSYNPFGYGIYGNKVTRFASYEEAIERVGRAIREDYLDKGLKAPAQIMTKYTPPSIALGGPWARGVSTFMEELR